MSIPYYIHDINPILLPIWGNLAIRWYGLAYISGFVAAYLILNRWGRRNAYPLHGEQLQSFLVAIVIGVMIGGRLGYVLFYDPANFFANPLVFFKLWEGGMASHGGILGLGAASWWYARKNRVPLLALTDGLACVAPIGLGLGRIANFINGELWGRVTTVRWAVLFPQEAGLAHGHPTLRESAIQLYQAGLIHPRHPSQLYQAALEGIVLLSAMLLLRKTSWASRNGRLTGAFLGIYTMVRVAVEFFREPEIVYFGWMSQGQLLSLVILLPVSLVLMFRPESASLR